MQWIMDLCIAHSAQVGCWIEALFEFSHWGSLRAALPSSCLFWQLATEPFAPVSARVEYLLLLSSLPRNVLSIFQVCGHLHYTEEDHDFNAGKEAKQLQPLGCTEAVTAMQETIETELKHALVLLD